MKNRFWLIKLFSIVFLLYSAPCTLHKSFALDAGRIQMSVPSPDSVRAGETITFQILVLNEGSGAWNTGAYSTNVDVYDANKIYKLSTEPSSEGPMVASGESALFFLSSRVPKFFGGQCFYKVNLKYSGKSIATSDFYDFNVIPVARNASISFASSVGNQKFDKSFNVTLQIKNTGEVTNNFPVKLEIKGALTGEVLSYSKTISLTKGEASNLVFECAVPITFLDSALTATGIVYDRIENDNPVNEFGKVSQEFKMLDAPPSVQLLNLGLSAVKGEEINMKVRVSDDNGVSDVKITYQIPGMDQTKTSKMSLFSGNKSDGVWVFKTAAFEATGRFVFIIEATDTRSQSSKIEYQTTVVSQ